MTEAADDTVNPKTTDRYHLGDYETVRAHGFSDYDIDTIKSAEHLKSRYPQDWGHANLFQEIIWGGWSTKFSVLIAAGFLGASLFMLTSPSALNLGLAPILLAAAIYNILDIEDDRLAGQMGILTRLNSPIFRQVKFKGQTLLDILGVGILVALISFILGAILTFFHLLSTDIEALILGAAGIIYLAYDVFYFGRQTNRRRAAQRIIAQALALDVQEEPESVRMPRKPVRPAKMLPLTPGVKLPGSSDDENF